MTIADDVAALVERERPLQLTEKEIAEILFGQAKGYEALVSGTVRQLVKRGRLERLSNGDPNEPYSTV